MKVTTLFGGVISGEGTGWKLSLIMLLTAFVASPLRAQAPPPEPPQAAVEGTTQKLAPQALNELLAPIALYPDALIALILPASTVPADLVLAARYIASNGDPAQIADQPWDDSVKSLVRYPDVLKWMDQNLDWTTALGEHSCKFAELARIRHYPKCRPSITTEGSISWPISTTASPCSAMGRPTSGSIHGMYRTSNQQFIRRQFFIGRDQSEYLRATA